MNSRQIPLDFEYVPALSQSDFVIGAANRDAMAWIDRWPDWPRNSLAIYGPEGSGKTHLSEVWRARSDAVPLDQPPLEMEPQGQHLVLERPSNWPERDLLHLLNRQYEAGQHVLIIDRVAPARWDVALADLRSRLSAIPAVELLAPDDELLMAVIAKHFADRNQTLSEEALLYLVQRIERSFAGAARIVAAIDRQALASKRRVNLALIRDALSDS